MARGMQSSSPTWTGRVLTIFPEMFPGPLSASLAGRALSDRLWALETVDIRDYARDKHRSVDDAPFGGGPGMVMRADVVDAALAEATDATTPTIYLNPRGPLLTQSRVRELADGAGVTLLCGRFEGIDERVLEARAVEEVSLGDFVLSGGEPAAMTLIDACVRLLPGVLGAEEQLVGRREHRAGSGRNLRVAAGGVGRRRFTVLLALVEPVVRLVDERLQRPGRRGRRRRGVGAARSGLGRPPLGHHEDEGRQGDDADEGEGPGDGDAVYERSEQGEDQPAGHRHRPGRGRGGVCVLALERASPVCRCSSASPGMGHQAPPASPAPGRGDWSRLAPGF